MKSNNYYINDMQDNEFQNFIYPSSFPDNSINYNLNLLSLSKPPSSESRSGQNDGATPIILFNDEENIQTRELSNNIELNEGHININNENINIFNNSHPEILFQSRKRGRPRNGQENNSNRNHSYMSYDNARKRIINSCKSNIYNLIKQYIPNQSDIKLHMPTIEKQLGYSYETINTFFNKTIYNIFCDTIPKRVKKEIKNNRNQYKQNKNIIDILLENEKNNEKKPIKELKGLFNLRFKDYLIAYLNDETQIKIFDNIYINLNGFKTFSSCFNEGNNKYDQSLKNSYKEKIMEMLGNN